MARRTTPIISPRKQPRQVRSARLVGDILEAANRVLVRDGARHFTTARVAERAGISVGSLYQYFPNKEAIRSVCRKRNGDKRWRSYAVSSTIRAWHRSSASGLRYERSSAPSATKRHSGAHWKKRHRSTSKLRKRATYEEGRRLIERFMSDVLPGVATRDRAFAADLIGTVMFSAGKAISSQNRSRSQVDELAVAVGEMFCLYLKAYRMQDERAR